MMTSIEMALIIVALLSVLLFMLLCWRSCYIEPTATWAESLRLARLAGVASTNAVDFKTTRFLKCTGILEGLKIPVEYQGKYLLISGGHIAAVADEMNGLPDINGYLVIHVPEEGVINAY